MADIEDLRQGINELEDVIRHSSVRGDHLFADLAALGLARDVLENAMAVAQIASSEVPRALYPSARAAFESLFELVFLVGSQDFDHMGCRVYISELVEHERSRGLAQRVLIAIGQSATAKELDPTRSLAEVVEEEAEGWDRISPGRGPLLRQALGEISAERARREYTWFGMSRTKLHKASAPLIGGGPDTEQLLESWYQLLSVQAHPAPRLNTHSLEWMEDGTFVFGTPDDQRGYSVGMGIGAAQVATKAAAAALRELPAKG